MGAKFYVRFRFPSGKEYITPASTKSNCIYYAQTACNQVGDGAEVVKEKRGGDVVVMRYWRDSEGLQYLSY